MSSYGQNNLCASIKGKLDTEQGCQQTHKELTDYVQTFLALMFVLSLNKTFMMQSYLLMTA